MPPSVDYAIVEVEQVHTGNAALPQATSSDFVSAFGPGVQTDSYDDWTFGPDASSLIGPVDNHALTPLATPSFTAVSVITAAGLLKGLMTDAPFSAQRMEIIIAKMPANNVSQFVFGDLDQGTNDGGSSCYWVNGVLNCRTRGMTNDTWTPASLTVGKWYAIACIHDSVGRKLLTCEDGETITVTPRAVNGIVTPNPARSVGVGNCYENAAGWETGIEAHRYIYYGNAVSVDAATGIMADMISAAADVGVVIGS